MRNIGISLLAASALDLPAAAKTAKKADVTCTDGTTAKAGRGACSHHGGVADEKTVAKKKSEKSAAAESKNKTRAELDEGKKETEKKSGGILDTLIGRKKDEAAQGRSSNTTPSRSTREAKTPRARCKDGTISYSAQQSGTCSSHGGVDQWLNK